MYDGKRWAHIKRNIDLLSNLFSSDNASKLSFIQAINTNARHNKLGKFEWFQITSLLKCIDKDFLQKIEESSLSEYEKQVLCLFRLGVSKKAISELYNIEISSVDKSIYRARKKLFLL
jgi:DNA-binding NarL/FixJ family response regulator